jgi:hypothetical protein
MQLHASTEQWDIPFSFVKRINKQKTHFNFTAYFYPYYVHVEHIMDKNTT